MTSDPTSRFAIVPVSHGPAPDDAIVIGPMSEVFEYIPQSVARNDAIAKLDRARFTAQQIASMQSKTRAVHATMITDSLKHITGRLDAFVQRRQDAARIRAARDEEEEKKRIQAKLDALPDPDDPASHGLLPGNPQSKLPDPEIGIEDQSEFPDPDDPHGPTGSVFPHPTAVGLDKKV